MVPTALKGSSPIPRIAVLLHSEKIFLIATPYFCARRPPAWTPSQTPEPRPAPSTLAQPGRGQPGRRPAEERQLTWVVRSSSTPTGPGMWPAATMGVARDQGTAGFPRPGRACTAIRDWLDLAFPRGRRDIRRDGSVGLLSLAPAPVTLALTNRPGGVSSVG